MKRIALGIITFLFAVPSTARSEMITVTGKNDASVDRVNLQAALDAAAPGDTVELVGSFQLDGQRLFISKSSLTLAGRALDNDGDGAVNEDWADGTDNDRDGRMDEDDWDSVVRGVANPDGSPAGDIDTVKPFNRGFVIEGVSGTLRQLAFRHIKFQTLHRAISIVPEWRFPTLLCDDQVSTGGAVEDITVEGTWFDNCRRGVQAFGQAAGLTVRNNLFTLRPPTQLGRGIGVNLLGGLAGCWGGAGRYRVGTPRMSEVANNRFTVAMNVGIVTTGTLLTTIRNNTVEGAYASVVISDNDEKGSVYKNELTQTVAGIGVVGPVLGASFSNNHLKGNSFGIYAYQGASGFTALNNRIEASSLVNVFLDPTTLENTVIATDFETTVTDLGKDNRLLGTLAMVNNPGVPEDVRQKLEELRREIAERKP